MIKNKIYKVTNKAGMVGLRSISVVILGGKGWLYSLLLQYNQVRSLLGRYGFKLGQQVGKSRQVDASTLLHSTVGPLFFGPSLSGKYGHGSASTYSTIY